MVQTLRLGGHEAYSSRLSRIKTATSIDQVRSAINKNDSYITVNAQQCLAPLSVIDYDRSDWRTRGLDAKKSSSVGTRRLRGVLGLLAPVGKSGGGNVGT